MLYFNIKSRDTKGNHDIDGIWNYFNKPPIYQMMEERKLEFKEINDEKADDVGTSRLLGRERSLTP